MLTSKTKPPIIVVLSSDSDTSEALTKAVRDLGIEAVATDSVKEALRLAPEATGIVHDQIPAEIDSAPLKAAPVPVVVVSLFGSRPILITPDRIARPFTLDWLRFAIRSIAPTSAAA